MEYHNINSTQLDKEKFIELVEEKYHNVSNGIDVVFGLKEHCQKEIKSKKDGFQIVQYSHHKANIIFDCICEIALNKFIKIISYELDGIWHRVTIEEAITNH